MKEFKSANHLNMVEGKLFNWQKIYEYPGNNGRVFLKVDIGSLYTLRQCLYNLEEKLLTISTYEKDGTQPFICDIDEAECIVEALRKGLKTQHLPLYKKI
jgi:hypothetical protein